jgi:hypothetical protein
MRMNLPLAEASSGLAPSRTTRAATFVAALALLASCAATPDATDAADATAMGRELELRRFAAMVAVDAAALESLLAPSLRYCHSTGRCETRAQFLDALRSGATTYRKIELTEFSARRIGTALLMGGKIDVDIVPAGAPAQQMQLAYTDVYERIGGRWQLVAWHSSRSPATN